MGKHKRRVAQLDKIVDKRLRKLIEDAAISTPLPDGKKLKARELRGNIQKLVAKINKLTMENARKGLRASHGAIMASLGGK